jgi:hypothetical protein
LPTEARTGQEAVVWGEEDTVKDSDMAVQYLHKTKCAIIWTNEPIPITIVNNIRQQLGDKYQVKCFVA